MALSKIGSRSKNAPPTKSQNLFLYKQKAARPETREIRTGDVNRKKLRTGTWTKGGANKELVKK